MIIQQSYADAYIRSLPPLQARTELESLLATPVETLSGNHKVIETMEETCTRGYHVQIWDILNIDLEAQPLRVELCFRVNGGQPKTPGQAFMGDACNGAATALIDVHGNVTFAEIECEVDYSYADENPDQEEIN